MMKAKKLNQEDESITVDYKIAFFILNSLLRPLMKHVVIKDIVISDYGNMLQIYYRDGDRD